MKKIFIMLAAAMLLFSVSGQAMAYFADGDLIRVVYSTSGTMESATDLGSISSLTTNTGANVVYNTNNFSMSQLGGTANYSNSNVAYYSLTLTPNPKNQAWVSGPTTGQTGSKANWSNYVNDAHNTNGAYQVNGGLTSAMITLLTSDPDSYWAQLDNSGSAVGQFHGFIPAGNGEASLSALATIGYVDQILYYYGAPSGVGSSATSLNVATIRTYADGHTVLNPVANTPVPPSVLLLGSGLLGLVGIRRKITL